MVKIARANTGWRPDTSRADLDDKYFRVEPDEVEAEWRRQYARGCGHKEGSTECAGAGCDYRSRSQTVHLLHGSVLPFWDQIRARLLRVRKCIKVCCQPQARRLARAIQRASLAPTLRAQLDTAAPMQIVRVHTIDGPTLVGITVRTPSSHSVECRHVCQACTDSGWLAADSRRAYPRNQDSRRGR